MKLNKSIRDYKKSYEEKCKILELNTDIVNLKNIYQGNVDALSKTEKMVLDPIYQRELCWTIEQKQSYIINLFNGLAKCNPTIIEYYSNDYNTKYYEILDGKQRLTTIFDFIDNKFPIIYENEKIYFNDLIDQDKKYLLRFDVKYTRIMPNQLNENLSLKDRLQIFLEINYLGTKMDDKHLLKIRGLYENEK